MKTGCLGLLMVIITISILISCSLPGDGDDSPGISIDQSDVTVYTGRTMQFTATPGNSDYSDTVWTVVSNISTDIGTIDQNGLYTPAEIDVLSADIVTVTVTAASEGNPSVTDSLDFIVEKRFHIVADINPSLSSNPGNFEEFNGNLYFCADGGNGKELWCYDGEKAYEVKDIYAGANNSSWPSYLKEYKGKLYFRANGGVNGYELWCYDGINDPFEVYDINNDPSGSNPAWLMIFDDMLYFRAEQSIWTYDGTDLTEIVIPGGGIAEVYDGFEVFKNKLYFTADGNNGTGVELWCYDGVNPPFITGDAVNPGAGDGYHEELTVFKNKLYFYAEENISDPYLWSYDGVNNPVKVGNIQYAAHLTVYNNRLYFQTKGELWCYDGMNSPFEVADIVDVGISDPTDLTVFNSKLFFRACPGDSELWCYDDTLPVNVGVNPYEIEINEGGGSHPALYVFNSKLYLSANDGMHGCELWVCNY
jgi:ELWxxDGT repeat protein